MHAQVEATDCERSATECRNDKRISPTVKFDGRRKTIKTINTIEAVRNSPAKPTLVEEFLAY